MYKEDRPFRTGAALSDDDDQESDEALSGEDDERGDEGVQTPKQIKRRCTQCRRDSPTLLNVYGFDATATGLPEKHACSVPFCSFLILWCAYFYVVISSLMFLLGPLSNIWVPQYGVYVTYPFSIMVGAHISYTWTHQSIMLGVQMFAALCAFIVNTFSVAMTTPMLDTLELTFDGVTKYTPRLSPGVNASTGPGAFDVKSDFNGTTDQRTLLYLRVEIAFFWMNMFFALIGFFLAAFAWWQIYSNSDSATPLSKRHVLGMKNAPPVLKRDPYEPELSQPIILRERHYDDGGRVDGAEAHYDGVRRGMSIITLFFVLVFLLWYFIFSCIQAFSGLVILTLFPNVTNSMLLMMLTISVFPPMGDHAPRAVSYTGKEVTFYSEPMQRFSTGIGGKSVHLIFGWILALIFAVWSMIFNGQWRASNDMPATCGDLRPFLGGNDTTNSDLYGQVIGFFGYQDVQYRPAGYPADSVEFKDLIATSSYWSCVDDVLDIILVVFGFIVFIVSTYTVLISLCPRNKDVRGYRDWLAEERKKKAADLSEEKSLRVPRMRNALSRFFRRRPKAPRSSLQASTANLRLPQPSS